MGLKSQMVFASLVVAQGACAQVLVRGTVTSEADREPVIGASVSVKGTRTGVVTDIDGRFELSVPEGAQTLVFSYIGMKTVEVQARPVMNVALETESHDIEEVIVVAYGTAKRSSFTGSAASVGKEKIAKLQVSEISKSLDGAMAGVQISSSTGQPGTSATIRVRGVGSISASSEPLIVLDGVPYEGNLSSINPQDIESMTVLKDAASNSLYGARGANGVVMITTKKGSPGRFQVSVDNRTGVNYRGIKSQSVLTSAKEYYELYWEALRNQQVYQVGSSVVNAGIYASENLVSELGGYNSYNVADNLLVNSATGRLNGDASLLYQDNWLDEAFGTGLRQENNVTMSGGTDMTNYFVSLGYLYDDSYTVQSDMTRYSVRMKIDQKITKNIEAGANLAAMTTDSNVPSVGSTSSSSIFYTGQVIAPIYPVYRRDENGDYLLSSAGRPMYDYGVDDGKKRPVAANSNAIDQQINNIRESKNDAVNAKLYVRANFLKDFNFTANVSVDNFNTSNISFQTPIGGDALNVNGRGTKTTSRDMSVNANQLLNWARGFGKHNAEVLIGHEYKSDVSSYLSATKENFFLPTNPELDNGVLTTNASSYKSAYSLEGYFSQVKYNFMDKYYLSGSFRMDASSRFHPDNRWGQFWSVGGAWRMNMEEFMAGATWVNDLKLRASFGTQGNDNLPNMTPYLDQYQVVVTDGEIGLSHIFRGNKDITWEKSNNFNIGVDFQLCDRLSGVVEYFYKQTWDMLYSKPLAPSQGSPTNQWVNAMRMTNQGVELELNYQILNTRDWNWSVSLNATHYTNELNELPEDKKATGWANGNKYLREGASIYNWYGYKWAGVDPDNGDALYYADITDDGVVVGRKIVNNTEEATRYEYGKTSVPDLYGGFSTSVRYRNFDVSLSMAYQIGGWAMDTQYMGFMHGGTAGSNWHKDIYQRWTPENRHTDVPRIQAGMQGMNAESDRFLTKASYLNLRNVTAGYTLPNRWISAIGASNLRVYVVGDNLFLLSARKGFDPRQSFSGSTGYSYSPLSTCSFGVSLTF